MERRVTSHTEEEEMNQRRHLLTLARKGDQESIDLLFEFYQVKVFTGDALNKKKLPSFPVLKPAKASVKGKAKPAKVKEKTPKVSLSGSKVKAKKEKTEKIKSVPKGTSKVQTKTVKGKPQAQKVKKTTKASPKKPPVVKKISPPKENKRGGKPKGKALGSAKKPKVAKKK